MTASLRSAWGNTIASHDVLKQLDVGMLCAEALTYLANPESKKTADLETAFDLDAVPTFADVRKTIIEPAARDYVRSVWGYEGVIEWERHYSWPLSYGDGRGLEIHNHPTAHLTSVLYLACSDEPGDSMLTFLDPRAHAGRFYPEAIRKTQFDPIRIQPRVGTLLVFPSYLQHYVAPGRPAMRISVNTDHTYELLG